MTTKGKKRYRISVMDALARVKKRKSEQRKKRALEKMQMESLVEANECKSEPIPEECKSEPIPEVKKKSFRLDELSYRVPKKDKLGCGKCRFSQRGCARCGIVVKRKQSEVDKIVEQKKALPKAGCSKCRFSQRGCARCKSLKKEKEKLGSVQAKIVKDKGRKKKSIKCNAGKELGPLAKDCRAKPSTSSDQPAESDDTIFSNRTTNTPTPIPRISKFVSLRNVVCNGFEESLDTSTNTTGIISKPDNPLSKDKDHSNEESKGWKDEAWWNPLDADCARMVKNALHMSNNGKGQIDQPLVRREEWTSVRRFISNHLRNAKAGSLYVSGLPGSGKSYIINKAIGDICGSHISKRGPRIVNVNCMALQDPKKIFNLILERAFKIEGNGLHERDSRYALNHLRKAMSTHASNGRSPTDMVILVLDEVDYLFKSNGDVLYDLFSLAEMANSKLIFVGIANSIDLTLRLLPHLHTIGVQPLMLTFRAYRHDELFALLEERLSALDGPVFDSKALELCSRKIAAASGDMRQCLNAAYSALETHIALWRDREESAPEKRKLVDIQQMSLALGKCLKLPLINAIRALPQHQQMILCASTFCEGEMPLKALFSSYSDLCRQTKISNVLFNEFGNMCTSLHDQGLVSIHKRAKLHTKTVKLKTRKCDVTFALQGIRFFHNLLNNKQ